MSSPMEPRITIRDEEDQGTVIAALVQYAHTTAARTTLNGDWSGMVDELGRVVGILGTLRDQLQTEEVHQRFGTLPDDDEIREVMDDFRDRYGFSD